MSATVALSLPLVISSSEQSTSQGPFDADRTADLYAIWMSVFERATAVTPATDDGQTSTTIGPARGKSPVKGAHEPVRGPSPAVSSAAVLGATAPTGLNAHPDTLHAEASQPVVRGGARVTASNTRPPDRRELQGDGLTLADLNAQTKAPRGSRVSQSTNRETLWPPDTMVSVESPDSVSVFVQEETVAVVVRDASLSDDEAMRCGFETARALTGRRTALKQLTLNGRTLYQQHSGATAGALPEPTLVFAC